MNLMQSLLQLAQENKLGHFYILEPTKSSPTAQAECENFCHDFIKNYFGLTHTPSPHSPWDHADVLTLGARVEQEEVGGQLSVEDALAFTRYFEFNPVSSPHKFAVITQASKITTIVANKWLKLLEEPHTKSTIILINSNRIKLLDTISSRAILLRLPNKNSDHNQEEFINFIKEARDMSLSQFLEKNQKNQLDLNYWVQQLIDWESTRLDGAQEKAQLGPWLLKLKEMDLFHQPGATKWSSFYQLLQSNVFGRLIH